MASVRFSFYPFTANTAVGLARQWELIDFEPVYQRRPGVWNTFRQQLFIDSIINGMDLPKIYFHELPLASTSHFRFAYRRKTKGCSQSRAMDGS
ncbi:MAG: hypothetical protein IPO51_14320 [Dehalococcoidia bacterium]|nr:hypothetical protein [Dehalococcoidia bacterium]